MHVAIIPARSGSKGVPNKNMLLFKGQSLIARTTQCAKETELFQEIILSTDSETYADEGIKSGCKVPYLRPYSLANDHSSISDVLLDLLNNVKGAKKWQTITLLEPTCPLRTPEMVINCFNLCYDNPEIDCSLTLTPVSIKYHPLKQLYLDSSGKVTYAQEEGIKIANRQELKTTYIRNGASYVLRCSSFVKLRKIVAGNVQGLVIKEPLVNIDTLEDVNKLHSIDH